MSDYQYDDDSYEAGYEDEQECPPRRKRLTKNQQIYGDFEDGYEPELEEPSLFGRAQSYDQFKAGSTIDRYSSEVEVTLPKSKPVKKKMMSEEEADEKPILGKFSLNSFLQQMGGEMDDIVEAANQDSSQEDRKPQGLNSSILAALDLVKIGEEVEQEMTNIQEMSFEQYLKANRKKAEAQNKPKYQTQEERQLAKQFKDGYGKGFAMLQKMGFKVNKGLGKEQTGIQRPVEAVHKTAFTMKDQPERQKKAEESQQSEKQEQEVSIYEKLFQYRSRKENINNFLMDLKSNYERLEKDIYYCQNEIESFKKEEQLKESLLFQTQNERKELMEEIDKLQVVQKDLYKCHLYPHLGLTYQLDYLYAKDALDKISRASVADACLVAERELGKLKSTLSGFYLAKAKETLNEFHKMTGVQEKMHFNLQKKKKKKEVINLDAPDDAELTMLGPDDEQKINKFIEMVITRSILTKIDALLSPVNTIDKVKDTKVIDLLEVVKKYDKKGKVIEQYIKDKVLPKCHAYINSLDVELLAANTANKRLPHVVLFPWLPVVGPKNLNLGDFYRRISSKLWPMDNGILYQIVSPWFKFSSPSQKNQFVSLYLAPRLMHQMQDFDLNKPNLPLLNGFRAYCEFMPRRLSEQILQNSLMLQLLQAYRKYQKEMGEEEVRKWIGRWSAIIGKALPGFVERYFKEMSIQV